MTEPTGTPRALFRSAPSGNLHDLERPDPQLIEMRDIAHHLGHMCRFGGGTSRPYSVAEHCVRVALLAPPEVRYRSAMHDSPEYVLGDVTRALKVLMAPIYKPLERLWEAAIAERFGIDLDLWQSEMGPPINLRTDRPFAVSSGLIKALDLAMGATEGCLLVAGYQPHSTLPIPEYNWRCIEERFGARYNRGTMTNPSVAAELFLVAVEQFANAKA